MRYIVHNFGPIKSADVILGKFNIFVGPGGTGKSYLAYLIWMLSKMNPKWETLADFQSTPIFGRVLDELLENKEITKESSNKLLVEIMQTYLKAHEDNFVKSLKDTYRIDNLDDIIYESEEEAVIKICNDENSKRIIITLDKKGVKINGFRELLFNEGFVIKYQKEKRAIVLCNGKKTFVSESLTIKSKETDIDVVKDELIDFIWLASHVVLYETIGYYSSGDPYILTDSKSGLLRTAPNILSYFLSAYKSSDKKPLNGPDRDMISKLNIYEKDITNEEISEVADFIENEIGGEIDINTNGPLFDIFFNKKGKTYPILRSNSGVRELAPLILYLRYVIEEEVNSLLVMEEAETHLHPYMQSVVTRALALLSKNINVLATTHSPVILDEVNTLIRLNKLKQERKKEVGYNKIEGLEHDYVCVYRFKNDGSVDKVKIDEDGIYDEEFSSVVIELSNKYADIDELISKS